MGPGGNAQYPNQILDEQIMKAIDAQLALKGLVKTDERPIWSRFISRGLTKKGNGMLQHRRRIWGWGGWGGWGGMGTTTTTSKTIHNGTLNLDSTI
jgi:hypothetical protein